MTGSDRGAIINNAIVAVGDRLVVGRRVLAPLARVRVLLPQPIYESLKLKGKRE